jgi:hypothetical protein
MFLTESDLREIEMIAVNETSAVKEVTLEYESITVKGWIQGLDPNSRPLIINIVSADGGPNHRIDFKKLKTVKFEFHGTKPDIIIGDNSN